jgi:hypothetical protein
MRIKGHSLMLSVFFSFEPLPGGQFCSLAREALSTVKKPVKSAIAFLRWRIFTYPYRFASQHKYCDKTYSLPETAFQQRKRRCCLRLKNGTIVAVYTVDMVIYGIVRRAESANSRLV